jgi:hypothetical protein
MGGFLRQVKQQPGLKKAAHLAAFALANAMGVGIVFTHILYLPIYDIYINYTILFPVKPLKNHSSLGIAVARRQM